MRAIYAFSGDPITFGHIDTVERAAATYDEVVVGIGENPEKAGRYLFTQPERLAMARQALQHIPNCSCRVFSGLLGEYAYRHRFDVVVRGVRNAADLEAELALFAVNLALHDQVDTVFFPTKPHLAHISSSVVKALVREGGDVGKFVPLAVKEALERKLLKRFYVGLAGGIASGKTKLAEQLVAAIRPHSDVSYISMDAIGHYVLGNSSSGVYQETRGRIAERFGHDLRRTDGSIDRKALGRIVFADPRALEELHELMREPMLNRLYEETRKIPRGIILMEGAILVEAAWSKVVNNNVVLVEASEPQRVAWLRDRDGISEDEALAKIRRQVTHEERSELLRQAIERDRWGRAWALHNETDADLPAQLAALARSILDAANRPLNGEP